MVSEWHYGIFLTPTFLCCALPLVAHLPTCLPLPQLDITIPPLFFTIAIADSMAVVSGCALSSISSSLVLVPPMPILSSEARTFSSSPLAQGGVLSYSGGFTSFSVSLPLKSSKSIQVRHDQSKLVGFHGIQCEGSSTVSTTTPTEWVQKTVDLPAFKRGCHIITRHIVSAVPEITQFHVGIAHIFVMHTSASLTINENASSDVPLDMEDSLNRIVPEGHHYRHLDEGLDDMPAHVKASMMGSSLTIPIKAGRLLLGMWQGIWLNEHRNYGGSRSICITIQGQKRVDGRAYR